MAEYSRQCKMQKITPKKTTFQVSWIPEAFAIIGNYVRLKEKNGWDDGWEIVSIGPRLNSKTVNERSQDYKKTRKASDI